jgi:hypothetical protein
MSAGVGSVAVAKKKARGVGIMVRIDPDVVRMARVIAPIKGLSMGDYLSDICRPVVSREYLAEIRRLEKQGGER